MPKTKKKYKSIDTIIMFIILYVVGALFITSIFVWTEVRTEQIVNKIFLTAKLTYIKKQEKKIIDNFEKCVIAGQPILESYPRQCINKDGQIFIENLGQPIVDNRMIKIASPLGGDFIESPLSISGQARGTWFFEASFPIVLMDEQGEEIGSAIATADGEWMTEEFVDFEAELVFDKPESNIGFLVFKKDNPSGLPEHDDLTSVPIFFK